MRLIRFFGKYKIFTAFFIISGLALLIAGINFLPWYLTRLELTKRFVTGGYEYEHIKHGNGFKDYGHELYVVYLDNGEQYLVGFQPFPYNDYNLVVGYLGFETNALHINPDLENDKYNYFIEIYMGYKEVNGEPWYECKSFAANRQGKPIDEFALNDEMKQILSKEGMDKELLLLFDRAEKFWDLELE
jgi:hypothetical protein